MNLCHAISSAREHNDLVLEETLYAVLIRLYRSPQALLVWTDPHLKDE